LKRERKKRTSLLKKYMLEKLQEKKGGSRWKEGGRAVKGTNRLCPTSSRKENANSKKKEKKEGKKDLDEKIDPQERRYS